MIDTQNEMSDTSPIPDALHEQLSRAGKKGAKKLTQEDRSIGGIRGSKKLTREARSLGGKRAWEARLKKAQDAERKQNEENNQQP